MWKILAAFIVFAVAAIWMISKGGDSVDMSGEKHGVDAAHPPASAASM